MTTYRTGESSRSRNVVCATIALLFLIVPTALGNPISGLYSTGMGAPGTLDGHWTVDSAPAYITQSGAFPFPYWFDDSATSGWISPQVTYSPDLSDLADTTFTFATSFTLPNQFTNASIIFRAATDNALLDVLLNGASVGFTTLPIVLPGDALPTNVILEGTGFSSGLGSTLIIGSGFVPGNNVLQFIVGNSATNPENTGNPAGLNLELNGTVTPTPEPESLLVLASGLASLALAARRRQR